MVIHHRIKHPIEKVFPFFADFEKFGSIHPYITYVSKKDQNFRVTETILFLGFIKNKNEYDVSIDVISDYRVVYSSNVKKGVELKLIFQLTSNGLETDIEEKIDIQANYIVKTILKNVIAKAHKQLVKNINELSLS